MTAHLADPEHNPSFTRGVFLGEIREDLVFPFPELAPADKENLTAILDYNGIQQTGATADVMPTEPIADKWRSFGWHVQEIHGHNVAEIMAALDRADEVHARPSMIIARTTKGKGVSFMEYDHRWHGMPPNKAQYEQALAELEGGLQKWQQ